MREILFRGKKVKPSVFDETDWVYGSLIDSGNHEQVAIYPWYDGASTMSVRQRVYARMEAVNPETVGQYTGLKDKSGTMIFEGDIVKSFDLFGHVDGCGIVSWNDLFTCWMFGHCKSMYGGNIATYEVIGNIHDNPDLVKEE